MSSQLQPATEGVGPLLQRDYWAVFEDSPLKPSEIIDYVRSHFCEFPPSSIVRFNAPNGISKDSELDIVIMPAQSCCVRVIHEDRQSFTLGTLAGHPEAGRITFGAYRNPEGEVVFHIRSRARAATTAKLIGFLAVGDAMQTNTWTDFIRNTAAGVGARIRDVIHADKARVDAVDDDDGAASAPTYLAVGD